MSLQFDEFSKSLTEETLPRRESLRRLGAVFAGALFGSLGLKSASTARTTDPCKAFCKCRNKSQQSQCIEACRACNNDPSGMCGSCGNYGCCGSGQDCCGNYCADLDNDVYNCGDCGYVCDPPGPYEYGACLDGRCEYMCVEGASSCNGECRFWLGIPTTAALAAMSAADQRLIAPTGPARNALRERRCAEILAFTCIMTTTTAEPAATSVADPLRPVIRASARIALMERFATGCARILRGTLATAEPAATFAPAGPLAPGGCAKGFATTVGGKPRIASALADFVKIASSQFCDLKLAIFRRFSEHIRK